MQATQPAATAPNAPYDILRPTRCRYEFQGTACNGRGGDIDWSKPGTHGFRCQKCRSYNVVHLAEPGLQGGAVRPLRCRFEFQGHACAGRGAEIDWGVPDTHVWDCPRCKTPNVVHVVEAARAE